MGCPPSEQRPGWQLGLRCRPHGWAQCVLTVTLWAPQATWWRKDTFARPEARPGRRLRRWETGSRAHGRTPRGSGPGDRQSSRDEAESTCGPDPATVCNRARKPSRCAGVARWCPPPRPSLTGEPEGPVHGGALQLRVRVAEDSGSWACAGAQRCRVPGRRWQDPPRCSDLPGLNPAGIRRSGSLWGSCHPPRSSSTKCFPGSHMRRWMWWWQNLLSTTCDFCLCRFCGGGAAGRPPQPRPRRSRM